MRDIETGLDFFGARYFASTQGRFTSSDPLLASGRTGIPQSWNRYSYVLNNPLRLIDPTGLADVDPQDPKKQKEQPKPLAVDEITVGGVKVKVEQMNEPAGFKKVINGTERIGVGVQLTITVTDANGKPFEGATAVETVNALEGPEVKQNNAIVPLDSQGRGSDFVTNSAPTPKNREQAEALIQQLKDPNMSSKQEFNLKVTLKSGTEIEVTQVRTLTNKTPEGQLQPEDRGLGFGPGVPSYTYTREPLKGKVISRECFRGKMRMTHPGRGGKMNRNLVFALVIVFVMAMANGVGGGHAATDSTTASLDQMINIDLTDATLLLALNKLTDHRVPIGFEQAMDSRDNLNRHIRLQSGTLKIVLDSLLAHSSGTIHQS